MTSSSETSGLSEGIEKASGVRDVGSRSGRYGTYVGADLGAATISQPNTLFPHLSARPAEPDTLRGAACSVVERMWENVHHHEVTALTASCLGRWVFPHGDHDADGWLAYRLGVYRSCTRGCPYTFNVQPCSYGLRDDEVTCHISSFKLSPISATVHHGCRGLLQDLADRAITMFHPRAHRFSIC